jgi:hypothetical protein
MAVGIPMKTTYANGDVLSASDINDITGTINLIGYGSPFVAGKNKIINGDFGIWQRGTSFSSPANAAYLADRFCLTFNGSGSAKTISRQTFTPGTAPVSGYEGSYFLRWDHTTAGTGATYNGLNQYIEDVRIFAGQTVTVSFWAKSAAAMTGDISFNQNFGSGGSGQVSSSATSFTTTTSWARYTATITLASISGKTIGTSSFLGLFIGLPKNATFTFDIWGVQVESGSTATNFTTATNTIGGELALCQRYYYRLTSAGTSAGYGLGYAYATTSVANQLRNPVTMRITPATLEYATVELTIVGAGNFTITGLAIDAGTSGPDYVTLLATGASGLTTYRPYSLKNASSASGYIGLSAEI